LTDPWLSVHMTGGEIRRPGRTTAVEFIALVRPALMR
jgi:hypothetical protein